MSHFKSLTNKLIVLLIVVFISRESQAILFTSDNDDIPVPDFISDENTFVKLPGQLAGKIVLIPSFLIGYSVLSLGGDTAGFVITFAPPMLAATIVSTPFYIIKKTFVDLPRDIYRKIKNRRKNK